MVRPRTASALVRFESVRNLGTLYTYIYIFACMHTYIYMYEYVYVFIWTIVQINSKECFEVYGNYVGIRLGRQESSIL